MRVLRTVQSRIRNLYYRLIVLSWRCRSDIKCGRVRIDGLPMIDLRHGGKLIIGDNVRLNSLNRGYHINMCAPVKLFADRPGAVIRIGDDTRIHGSCIHAYSEISIGSRCLIAANCNIMDGSGHDLSFENVDNRINTAGEIKPVIIEDSVWICANTMVLPGVTIGRGTVVSAGSVVTRSLPPMVLAGGNPARVIKSYNSDGTEMAKPER